jgi:putative transposase
MDKFKNKYRIPSTRLQNWDYSNEGAYFITICTQNRTHFFGEITNGIMTLSNVGVIADLMWFEIKNHAKVVELGEFIVMPNHIHGILILKDMDNINNNDDTTEVMNDKNGDGDDIGDVETRHALSLPPSPLPPPLSPSLPPPNIGATRFQNQGKNSVSSIIGSYKSAVTKHANRLSFEFGWQDRFHDHIIRDARSFETIQNYIANNPSKWMEDKFF